MTDPNFPRPAWLVYFRVNGIESAALRIVAAGGQVIHGPMEVPGGGWIVNGLDPEGAMFALTGPSSHGFRKRLGHRPGVLKGTGRLAGQQRLEAAYL